ncbi:protein MPE1 [Nematocida sp. LUAm3]|nr:protein MPE1 [Nematocida sp. LUAm3]KAI5175667.1 protein MPE1 [Nematocida sp. LUAm2]KAI5178573.1 protein MPE1 [Nematocida sp. LUAm1]
MQLFYRFRSEREFQKIETDRSNMPLWELRTEIIGMRHLSLHDYHLIFYFENEDTPISDNYTTIHANTRIIVERVPNYMHIGYKEAMEKEKKEEGEEQKESSTISMLNSYSAKIPPPSYVCFRCGEKGHYIQMCPTNSNKQFDGMRVRKATGIPKTFLVPAEDAASSVLLNEEGKFVRAQPQKGNFSKYFGEEKRKVPENLKCPVCSNLFTDPLLLPCKHSVCSSCLTGKCPICSKKTENSITDRRLSKKIEQYLENH